MDGALADSVWARASWSADFAQREPVEGGVPASRTSIAFAYDDEALYVAARMQGVTGEPVRALVTRRDREGTSEQLVISLDTYHDRRTAYSFGVTAAGVRVDYYHPADAQGQRDYSFDPVWLARTERHGSEWTAELRIPFSQLRFNDADAQSWGVNVSRIIPARNEEDYWVLVKRNETGWASRFGELEGITGIRPRRRAELVPYAASDASMAGARDVRNPFVKARETSARAGADLKVGIGSSLTLDATINPDFGQVELDPAEVNLSAFETVFAERRPFFVENSNLLRSSSLAFFQSRRIGQAPRLRPAGDFVEAVPNTTILGAAKLTGQLQSGLSIGVLAAATGPEKARTFSTASGAFAEQQVEPATAFGVVRLQQQFGRDASTVAVMLTGVDRREEHGSVLASLLARRAYSGVMDYNLRFRRGEYTLSGGVGFSYLDGDSTAILRVQQSSAHFLQRPDAKSVRLDPSLTALPGGFVSAQLARNTGRLLWNVYTYRESESFDVNDAGRIGAADDMGVSETIRWRQTKPGTHFRYWDAGVANANEWNTEGIKQFTQVSLFSNVTLKNFWSAGLSAGGDARALSDNLTRGGPLAGTPADLFVNAGIANNPARKTRWSANLGYALDEFGGRSGALSTGISIRPGTQWELSADPRYSHSTNTRQFVASLGGGTSATYGRRYLFGTIERSELSMRLRVNYALTPDLTLETYAEPFAASGRYESFGELPQAGARELRMYGTNGTTITRFGNDSTVVTDGSARFPINARDFGVLSFRSSSVLRWEWRPGSTAYLVWQQNRSGSSDPGRLVRATGLWDAIGSRGDNIVALKVAWWMPVR